MHFVYIISVAFTGQDRIEMHSCSKLRSLTGDIDKSNEWLYDMTAVMLKDDVLVFAELQRRQQQ